MIQKRETDSWLVTRVLNRTIFHPLCQDKLDHTNLHLFLLMTNRVQTTFPGQTSIPKNVVAFPNVFLVITTTFIMVKYNNCKRYV